ncbi:sigma-70 family RNA polymerase sigma factor, partial [Pseudactinotalea sp.]|uniref:sigma-70 family RNA polymerase sigma factor n=1 Tax=Pseudactinotalea sp. TaxID=1926260 RepID=UPI003B3BC0B5
MSVAVDLLERAHTYRGELLGYCYRYLGSAAEAEDAVQETLVRAWDKAETFRGEAALRTWLYAVAVRVCIDMGRAPQRRALPMDLQGPGTVGTDRPALGDPLPPEAWVWPMPDDRMLRPDADPAEVVAHRDTVRLAFLAALQHLPPRQWAVLILRDVLAFSAAETAQVLELSVDA